MGKPNGKTHGEKQKETQTLIIRQACLKAACSSIQVTDISDQGIDYLGKQSIKLAEILEKWVLTGGVSEKGKKEA